MPQTTSVEDNDMTSEYQALRTLVDSWGLVVMVVYFVAATAMALRPGSRQAQQDGVPRSLNGWHMICAPPFRI